LKIQSIHIRKFRSVAKTSISHCGPLNVFIGKNNAGKSNLLAAIEVVIKFLKGGTIAGPWEASRPLDEFTDRDASCPVEIGIEFELPPDVNAALRERLTREAPHLQKSIEQIADLSSISFVLNGSMEDKVAFLFARKIVVGKLQDSADGIVAQGIEILSVSPAVARELFNHQREAHRLRSEVKMLEALPSRAADLERAFARRADYPPNLLLNSLRISPQMRPSKARNRSARQGCRRPRRPYRRHLTDRDSATRGSGYLRTEKDREDHLHLCRRSSVRP
jgi:hypothetical protein